MVVNHNIPALFTHLSMRRSDRGLQQAMTRLSSGVRINSAREDAAGLAIANKLNYQVGGLRRASENATHGISLIQTAEGALNEVHNMLQRMRELSVQAAHGTLTNDNRAMIQLEIEQLTAEIHSISRNTEFNRMRILNGEANRVVDNSILSADATGVSEMTITRNIVNTLFVSHQVPPGRMNYTIQQAGRGAYVQFEPELDAEGRFVTEGSITINGRSFPIPRYEDPETGEYVYARWEDVRNEMNAQLQFLGMSMHSRLDADGLPDGTYFVVTNLAGSGMFINLSGDLALMGVSEVQATNEDGEALYYMLDAGGDRVVDADGNYVTSPMGTGGAVMVFRSSDRGQDAIVTTRNPIMVDPDGIELDGVPMLDADGNIIVGGLIDVNGFPIPGSSLAATAIGNQVLIRGSQGEDIRINIQVMFCAQLGGFRFPGVANDDPDYGPYDHLAIDAMTGDFGLNMVKDFRSFGPIMLQIGPSHNTAMPVQIPRLNSETLGLVEYVGGRQRSLIDVRPTAVIARRGSVIQTGAEAAIDITDAAIHTVSNVRARLGAYQNRLESTVRNLDVAAENTEISRSRIQDTDMARETTRFAQYNVMFQAAMSILGQANQRPQQIISLLQ